ncbi:MAG: hypothetical protein GTO63_33640 [Anaerolineae bacterium]|nr:hypothetical protein [Anaerolineae bacterium]NIN99580.1 hypothetical protein [Anaerolineae bacterium]NIQ82434.1 hypothetical protein [Anaerolineae bacterium]
MTLSEPSKELAIRLLGDVSFEERLRAANLTPMRGSLEHSIYGFRQAVNFLRIDEFEDLVAAGPRASVAYIHPDALRKWVAEVLGDTELADAIGEAIAEGANYVEIMRPVKELMEHRLSQCDSVLASKSTN